MKIIKLFTFGMIMFAFGVTYGQWTYDLSYDGVDDYVDLGNDASLNITGAITVEAWIYHLGNMQLYERIVEKDWETSYYLGGSSGSNGIAFCMDANSNTANVLETSSNVITPLNWTHIAGTWDGATLKIYINGVLEASMPWVNTADGSVISTKIGKYWGNSGFFKGYIDEVRIWSEAKTEAQIRDNMYRTLVNPAAEATLAGYWMFEEFTGQTTADISANNNIGVLGGTIAIESSDPLWHIGHAPVPYRTLYSGDWENNDTWESTQTVPFQSWARVLIKHAVQIHSNPEIGYLTIAPGASLNLNSTYSLIVNNDIRIQSDATGSGSFIPQGTVIYGNAIVERYYAGGEWHLISSPVQSAVSGLFTGQYLQSFDESTNGYSDIIPTNTPLVPAFGYAIWNGSNSTAEFTGMMNDGSIGSTNNLSRSGAGSTNYGWNLMGNPFPSSVDWDAASGWIKTNVNNATYVHVNASTWAEYAGGVGINGGSRYIASGQGFFVSVTDGGGVYPEYGTLIMGNGVRVHNNTPFYKDEIANMVRLQISGNNYSDETVIRFTENATTGFDGDLDAHKLFGYQAEAAQIYSHLNQDYGINALPEIQNVTVGVKAGQAGTYTIAATDVSEFETLILEDLLTGSTTNLLQSTYTFDYVLGTLNERFILHFSPLTGIQDKNDQQAFVFASNGNLIVSIPGNQNGNVSVYSLNGQLIKTANVEGSINTINMDQKGAYIVKVVTDSFVVTKKISLN